MNCPKCGFVQEERTDCRKCGVVFAKFLALRALESAAPLETQEPQHPQNAFSEEHHDHEEPALVEVRQDLQVVQQRFKELEFEKAERRRIQGEIRALNESVQESVARIMARQEDLEQRLSRLADLPPAPSAQEFAELKMEVHAIDVESVRRHLETVENRLQSCMQTPAVDPEARLLELRPELEQRLLEIESRIDLLAQAKGAAAGNDAQLDTALKGIEELKAALQNVTVRYTEIGELKKNHLVLRDMLESLQQATERFRKESTNGNSGKVVELEKEVFALKAEVRKAYERMELLETKGPQPRPAFEAAPLTEVISLREEVAASGRLGSEQRQQMQAELSTLAAKVNESLQTQSEIPDKLESFSSQIRRLDQEYQRLTHTLEQVSGATNGGPQNIADLDRNLAALREEFRKAQSQLQALHEKLDRPTDRLPAGANPQTPGEMGAIRENLDEIRHFMASLSQKLQ